MDFLLWVARSLHIFSVAIWLGGLTYQAVVVGLVSKAEKTEFTESTRHMLRRFTPFVWLCLWTVLVTGVGLMLFDPRFLWFQYHDRWAVLLGLKQFVFLLMLFFSFGYARMFSRVDEILSGSQQDPDESPRRYFDRMMQFGRINIALGIVAVLLAAGLH
ncbi:MAG: CopD family protein [Ignavibacteriae bacterium]|nr:CopD family protein [Ignavibacteriota bacterium]